MKTILELTCGCCGITQEFENGEEAFEAGWDAPPHFTGYIACNLCPAAFIVMRQTVKHDSVHAQWDRDGRPSEFSQATCLAPEDRVSENIIDAIRDAFGDDA